MIPVLEDIRGALKSRNGSTYLVGTAATGSKENRSSSALVLLVFYCGTLASFGVVMVTGPLFELLGTSMLLIKAIKSKLLLLVAVVVVLSSSSSS